nr:hypothetical protein [Tanacetum cinerariifolium]GEV73987.1 hypothetical protein [Tanacetum cinerariifolium]
MTRSSKKELIQPYKEFEQGQLLKEPCDNTFSGSDNEDSNERIERVLKIVDLFTIPDVTHDQLMLCVFPISLTRGASRWIRNEPDGLITTWETLKGKLLRKYCSLARIAKRIESKCNDTSNGLAAIQAQLNNLRRKIKIVNKKVYASQVGCKSCNGPHYTKDCPLKDEGKTLEEAYTLNLEYHFPKEEDIEQLLENNRILEEILKTLNLNHPVGEPEGSDDYTEVPFGDEQILRHHNTAHVTHPGYTSSIPFLATIESTDTLLMGDEVISTTPEKENDEFIKSSVDDLVPIPKEEEDFDINSPLGEQVVNFLMENVDVVGLPRHLVKQLFNNLIKNPSLTKGISYEPLVKRNDEGDGDPFFWFSSYAIIPSCYILTERGGVLLSQSSSHIGSLRRLIKEKSKIEEEINATINIHCSTILEDAIPPKEKRPMEFYFTLQYNNIRFQKALADLGASVIVMPFTTFTNLGSGELPPTKLIIELADRTINRPKGLTERMKLDLESRLMREALILNRSLDLEYGEYIKLNDLNELLELRRNNRTEELDPTIKVGDVIDEPTVDIVKTRHDVEKIKGIDEYLSFCDYDRKIHIDCAYNLQFSCMIVKVKYKGKNVVGTFINVPILAGNFFVLTDFAVLGNMDAYHDRDIGDVIVGIPFCRASYVEANGLMDLLPFTMVMIMSLIRWPGHIQGLNTSLMLNVPRFGHYSR